MGPSGLAQQDASCCQPSPRRKGPAGPHREQQSCRCGRASLLPCQRWLGSCCPQRQLQGLSASGMTCIKPMGTWIRRASGCPVCRMPPLTAQWRKTPLGLPGQPICQTFRRRAKQAGRETSGVVPPGAAVGSHWWALPAAGLMEAVRPVNGKARPAGRRRLGAAATAKANWLACTKGHLSPRPRWVRLSGRSLSPP
jgi:hypothetical protein